MFTSILVCVCAININVETIPLPYAFLRGPKTRPLSNDLREIKKEREDNGIRTAPSDLVVWPGPY